MRRLLLLCTTTLALTLIGSAHAQGSGDTLGLTLSCSVGGQTLPDRGGCTLERRILTLLDLEVTIGIDGRVARGSPPHLGPMVAFVLYLDQPGAPVVTTFLELLPISVLPPHPWGGWRAGFTVRF